MEFGQATNRPSPILAQIIFCVHTVDTTETMFSEFGIAGPCTRSPPTMPVALQRFPLPPHLVKLAPVGSARPLKPERLRNMETSLERGPLLERFVSGRVALSLQNYHLNQRFSLTA